MVPVLNTIGTDVACVGVCLLHVTPSQMLIDHRTTTSISALDNFAISLDSANFRGYWRMFWVSLLLGCGICWSS